jgi:hypothetical protein
MNAKEKIEIILSHLNLKAPTLASNIGVDYARIFDIQREKTKKISGDVANAIHSKYPEFDLNWILTGEGSMLKTPVLSPEIFDYERKYFTLLEDNNKLLKDKLALIEEKSRLEKELSENKKAGASMDVGVADAV